MNPNPQEKCITIRTIGKRTRSCQIFPIRSEEQIIAIRYAITGARKSGEIKRAVRMDKKVITRFNGGARYRKLMVP